MERQNKSVRLTGGLFSLISSHAGGESKTSEGQGERVQIQAGPVTLEGDLDIPQQPSGLVIFVHSSGSSRKSPRNRLAARELHNAGLATLLFDLLTHEEEEMDVRTHHLRYDVSLLARRTIGAIDWIAQKEIVSSRCYGLFGASTGAAAALIAAAERPERIGAVVSRGGRPDLATAALARIYAPVLFLVAQRDSINMEINRLALQQIHSNHSTPLRPKTEMRIVPGAGALFEEPIAAKFILKFAVDWFRHHLDSAVQGTKQVNKG